jgi:hypothetical protein
MGRNKRGEGFRARITRASVHAMALVLVCATSFSAQSAVSPFDTLRIHARPGVPATASITVPLHIPASQLAALYGPTVLYDSADPAQILAFSLVGIALPVTVSSLVALAPGAQVDVGPITATLSGDPQFTLDLGDCAAPVGPTCTLTANFLAAAPGSYATQVIADPPPVTISNGGVFGALITFLYPFASNVISGFLVFNVAALAGVPDPVPANNPIALLLLVIALAWSGSRLQRRRATGA